MKTGDLVKKFGVSEATIRRWSADFKEHLSPQQGRRRSYTREDYIVIATIYELFSSGLTQRIVEQKLREGYRVAAEEVSEIGYSDGRMVPAAVVEQVIDASGLRAELEQVKFERDRLMDMLTRSEQARTELQKELNEKVDHLQQEIARLQRELGRAEARAEIYKSSLDKLDQNNSST